MLLVLLVLLALLALLPFCCRCLVNVAFFFYISASAITPAAICADVAYLVSLLLRQRVRRFKSLTFSTTRHTGLERSSKNKTHSNNLAGTRTSNIYVRTKFTRYTAASEIDAVYTDSLQQYVPGFLLGVALFAAARQFTRNRSYAPKACRSIAHHAVKNSREDKKNVAEPFALQAKMRWGHFSSAAGSKHSLCCSRR